MTQRQPSDADRRSVQSRSSALLEEVRTDLAKLEAGPVVGMCAARDLVAARRQLALADAAAAQRNVTLATHHAYLAAQIARLAEAQADKGGGDTPNADSNAGRNRHRFAARARAGQADE